MQGSQVRRRRLFRKLAFDTLHPHPSRAGTSDRRWPDRRSRSRPGADSAARSSARRNASIGRSRKTPRPSGQAGEGDHSRGLGTRRPGRAHRPASRTSSAVWPMQRCTARAGLARRVGQQGVARLAGGGRHAGRAAFRRSRQRPMLDRQGGRPRAAQAAAQAADCRPQPVVDGEARSARRPQRAAQRWAAAAGPASRRRRRRRRPAGRAAAWIEPARRDRRADEPRGRVGRSVASRTSPGRGGPPRRLLRTAGALG